MFTLYRLIRSLTREIEQVVSDLIFNLITATRTAEPPSIVDLASEIPGFRTESLAGGNTIVYTLLVWAVSEARAPAL